MASAVGPVALVGAGSFRKGTVVSAQLSMIGSCPQALALSHTLHLFPVCLLCLLSYYPGPRAQKE